MRSKPPPSTKGEAAQLHSFPGGSDVANLIARLTDENERLRHLAALLTSQVEVMRGSIEEEDQPTSMRRVSTLR
jgi:hypothetical protein